MILLVAAVAPVGASAAITPTRDAATVAQAMTDPLSAGVFTSASFPVIPPDPGSTTECSDGQDNDDDGKADFSGGDPGCPTAQDNREQDDPPPECSDGEDNDFDGKADFPSDPGCASGNDLDEGSEGTSITPECSDGQDNDGDGKTDAAGGDPGCPTGQDNREEDDATPECSDGEDNDFDGKTDFSNDPESGDPGCDSALDPVEDDAFPNFPAACSDDQDNDGDGKTDFSGGDPGCTSADDVDEGSEGLELPSAPECSDGEDNDNDGKADFSGGDPGCPTGQDNREQDDSAPQCSDGEDNDGDGKTDFSADGETKDPGCDSSQDNDEGSEGFPPASDPDPAAVSDSSLTGFPTSGSSYAVLSSGNANFADDPNSAGSTGQSSGGGDGGHGGSFHDVITLRVNVNVPANANCLSVDFRFLSEEFPEYVGSSVNDGFVAELDTSDFAVDPSAQNNKIAAPHNFAFDGQGEVISINTTGSTQMSATEAGGTTYDGATPLLRASTPVTAGTHALYFSVFDQGDSVFDSAAFIDNLRVFSVPSGSCNSGATTDTTPPDTTITSGPSGATNDHTPTFEFSSSETGSTFECKLDAGDWGSCSTPHTTGELSDGEHTFEVQAIDGVGNVDPTPASRTFTVVSAGDDTPPDTTITSGPSGVTSDDTPTFGLSSSESGSTFECKLDSGDWSSCSSPLTTASLSDGEHSLQVRASDALGNTDLTPATRTFTVDTTPPDTTIVSGPSGATTDKSPSFGFTSSEPTGASFQCKLDGPGASSGSYGDCTPSPKAYPNLADGSYTFSVKASDAAGNEDPTPATRTFTVETPKPPPAVCSDGQDNDADGKVDYPGDPGCSSASDGDESNPPALTPPPANHAPSCSTVSSTPKLLWPPNHKFRLITLSGGTDPDGDPVSLTVIGVTQDELLDAKGSGDGKTKPDAKLAGAPNKVYVRAERAAKGNGRVYRISFTGSDGKGGQCSGTLTVGVPHHALKSKKKGKKKYSTPKDSGRVVNSFGP